MPRSHSTSVRPQRKKTCGPSLAKLRAQAKRYAAADRADRTNASYASAWAAFEDFCSSHRRRALPATGETVSLFLTFRAEGHTVATLTMDLAAISHAHKAARLPSPRGHQEVLRVFSGIRREKGTAQRMAAPLLPEQLAQIVAALPKSRRGLRDKAILLLGFSAALRREELCSLRVADVAFAPRGVVVTLPRSKTNQEGALEQKAVTYAKKKTLCPVLALKAWLEREGLKKGPIFRELPLNGELGETPLTGRSLSRIVKRSVALVGLDEAKYSGHSLRAGFATAAAAAGFSEAEIMRQTGHRSPLMARRYIRDAELWQNPPGAGLL